jgi:prolyl oligopeptidase
VLGTDPETDVAVLGSGLNPGVAVDPIEFPTVSVTPGSDIAVGALIRGVQNEVTLYTAPLDKVDGPNTPWIRVADPSDAVTGVALHGHDLYLLTHKDASRFKVLRVDAAKPDIKTAATVVEPGEAVITAIGAAADALYVEDMDGGPNKLRRRPYDGGAIEPVPLPFEGAIEGMSTDALHDGPLFGFEGWVRSRGWYTYAPKSGTVADTGILPPSPVDVSPYESKEVKAKSADGTDVPLSIVSRKGLSLDGTAPTLLLGYGAYGISINPVFAPRYLTLLEKGGVWAVCHVRGGGEYGEDWHVAGKKLTKQNTISDLIGCAQYLIDQKLTTPARLAINGGSAGGILVGGALTQRPGSLRGGARRCRRVEFAARRVHRERPAERPRIRLGRNRGWLQGPLRDGRPAARQGRHPLPGRHADDRD